VLGSLIGRFITEEGTEGHDNKYNTQQTKELSSAQKSDPQLNLRLESLPSVEIVEV